MGEVDGFKGASLLSKSALVLLAISTLFLWIAFTCTGWVVEKLSAKAKSNAQSHIGLWRMCSNNENTPNCVPTDGWANDWYAACQALVTFGFLGINVALFLLILYMFVPSCQKKGEIAKATAVVGFITGALYLIGVIVFAAKYKDDIDVFGIDLELSYCFGRSCVALILEIVAGVLVLQDSKKGGTSPSEITLCIFIFIESFFYGYILFFSYASFDSELVGLL